MADLGGARRARRPDRAGDALEVERERHRRAVGIASDHREQAGQALLRMARQLGAGDGEDGLRESLAQAAETGNGRRSLGARELVRGGQADRTRDVLGPGPAMALLRPALLLREDVRPVPDVQGADTLGTLELVRAERHEIRPERAHVEVDVWRRLDGVDVQEDALVGLYPARDLGDRLDGPDLVVGEHDRDQDRAVGERGVELVGVDPSVPIDRQLDDLEAELLEVAQRVTDRVVLDR